MTALYDHIHELRLELRCCYLTRDERRHTEAELATAIAAHQKLERTLDLVVETLALEGR